MMNDSGDQDDDDDFNLELLTLDRISSVSEASSEEQQEIVE
jgi:hypothetical protein